MVSVAHVVTCHEQTQINLVKRLPVHHQSAEYILWFFGIIELFRVILKKKVLF